MSSIKLYTGDNREVLKELPDNSVDSVVTDPPYELGFMGKKWDNSGIAYNVTLWKEVLRVLKPGGYLLSFGGSRTYHRMAVAIEDAGFEIRDQIMWVYGSGFPKSMNIGKVVDTLQGNERKVVGKGNGKGGENLNKLSRGNGNDSEDAKSCGAYGTGAKQISIEIDITKGTSEYEGWGTALKPAHEPICMARKPISEKTVAENCLKWGTGGINIDESRVGTTGARNNGNSNGTVGSNSIGVYSKAIKVDYNMGRFPANFIHDGSDEVVNLFPDGKGAFAPVNSGQKGFGGNIYGKYKQAGDDGKSYHGDGLGSAARFFYCAKASKSERNEGCEYLDKKNNHPTIKPITLMEYLIKLVTPTNGTVLDPFMGSGTTGIASKQNGFGFVGIEYEPEYVDIARARIEYSKPIAEKKNKSKKVNKNIEITPNKFF